jgi:hypothetical protein
MLPIVEPVFIFRDDNALLMLLIVPVTTNRVLFPLKVNPLAAVKPVVVVRLNVVPNGGLTKLIDVNNTAVELNPLNTNPLPSCPMVDCVNDFGSGLLIVCPNPNADTASNNIIVTNFFI